MNPQEAFNAAAQLHRSGRLAEAKTAYAHILATHPDHAAALGMTGLIALHSGDPAAALDFLERAIAANPYEAIYHGYLGQALAAAGSPERAIAAYRQSLHINPKQWSIHFSLGNALHRLGQTEPAVSAYRRAAQLQPNSAEILNNLGAALDSLGQSDEAIAALSKAVAIRPAYGEAHCNLGRTYARQKSWPEAIAAFDKALQFDATNAGFRLHRLLALRDSRQWDAASAACNEILAAQPNCLEAELILGECLLGQGRNADAIDAYQSLLNAQPNCVPALNHMGVVLLAEACFDLAMTVFDTARTADPLDANAQWSYAMEQLRRGDFENGWPGYRWRWRRDGRTQARRLQPRWNGDELSGKSIVIYSEQGYGDTIQFIRFLPAVTERGGTIAFACQPALHRLLKCVTAIDRWIDLDSQPPDHDFQCPLMDLPEVLGTTMESIPSEIPYLQPEAELFDKWRQRLSGDDRRKIGLCWANRPTPPDRSPPPELLKSFSEISDVRFISLQKWETDMLRADPPLELTDWTSDLTDFAETAALIANLDLIITVDTAVGHIAGAMGKPVWVMLKAGADWRWMIDRTDSPWYPTMRLFRQPRPRDWESVMGQIGEQLRG